MSSERSAIDLVEAAYHTDLDTRDWLAGLIAAVPRHADSVGVDAYSYRIGATGQLELLDIVSTMPKPFDDVTLAAMPMMPASYVAETWAAATSGTVLGTGSDENRKLVRGQFQQVYGAFGLADIAVINGLDPTGHGVFVGDLLAREVTLSRRAIATASRVASHIAAAFRLRRTQHACDEAVLTPHGKIEHAEAAAQSAAARSSLRDAALAIDRARSRRRRASDDAVEMWHALIAGRWSLVERFERDGRRYFIARKNDPQLARHHALTARERQVVGYAVLGHSNKLISYELGLSVSTITGYLTSAAGKLGVGSRAELIRVARAFGPAAKSR